MINYYSLELFKICKMFESKGHNIEFLMHVDITLNTNVI